MKKLKKLRTFKVCYYPTIERWKLACRRVKASSKTDAARRVLRTVDEHMYVRVGKAIFYSHKGRIVRSNVRSL